MKKITLGLLFFTVGLCLTVYAANTPQKFFEEGKKAYDSGDYKSAINYYEKAIAEDPNFAEAYNNIGMAYRNIGVDLSEVAWYFKVAIDINPKYAEAYDNLSKTYYALGDFDKAERYAKDALDINPGMVSIHYSLAWIYLLGKSQPKDAIMHFEKILEIKKIPYAYYGLGLSYMMDNKRAMVLEVITNLRHMDQDKLATRLEDILRGHKRFSQTVGPLVTMPPIPQGPKEGVLVPTRPGQRETTQKDESPQNYDLGGQTMRVRLRGNLTNSKDVKE